MGAPAVRRREVHTQHGLWGRRKHAAVVATLKKRKQGALWSSCCGVTFGWGARVLYDDGWEDERIQTRKSIRGYNKTGEPTEERAVLLHN